MAVKLGVLLMMMVVVVIVDRTEGACNFPAALSGVWRSSRWGDVTFSQGNLLDVTGMNGLGNVQFQCELSSGNTYVIRSVNTVVVLGNTVYVIACLEFNQLSADGYVYYHSTSDTSFSGGAEPVAMVSPSVTITTTTACNAATHSTGTNDMMIRAGSELNAGVQCPNPFLATFDNYTIDLGSGAQCAGQSTINVCNDRKNVTVSGACSTKPFYSSGGDLQCVHSTSSGSTYYANLYNFDASVDDSTTFRFCCLAITYGSDGFVYASQYPQSCVSAQTSTSTPNTPFANGGVFQLSANVTCLPTSSSSSSNIAIIIVIVILLLIIIVLVALAVYHFYYRKRWPAFKRKVTCSEGKTKGAKVDPSSVSSKKESDCEAGNNMTEVKPTPAQEPPAQEAPMTLKEDAATTATQPGDSSTTQTDNEVTAINMGDPTTNTEIIGDSGEPLSVSQPRRLPPLETHADMPGTPSQEVLSSGDA